jgi:hypothetical protein
MNRPDRMREFLANHTLHYIASRARSESALDIYVTFKRGENNGASSGSESKHVANQIETGGVAKTKVDQSYIRVEVSKHAKTLSARTRCTDDLHVRLHRDNADQSVADDGVIVNAQDSDSLSFRHLLNSMAAGGYPANVL